MMHSRFQHVGHSFAEARLLRMAPGAAPEKKPDPQQENIKLKEEMAKMREQMNVMQKRLEAMEKTKAVIQKPSSQYDARAVVRPGSGLSSHPAYNARMNSVMGASQYYPRIAYSDGVVSAEPVSSAARSYFRPGHRIMRYDKFVGKVQFEMGNDGQWKVVDVESAGDMTRKHDEYQEMWRQRDAAKRTHERMLQYYLNRARQGQPIPNRADMAADFAQHEYLEGMARGERPVITNQPFLINNPGNIPVEMMTEENRHLVPGTSEFTPVYRPDPIFGGMRFGRPRTAAQEKAIYDAVDEQNKRWDALEARFPELRGKGNAGGQPSENQSAYDDSNETDRTGSFRQVSHSREVSDQREGGSDFAPRNINTFKYNKGIRIAIPSRMGMNGGEDVAVKIVVPKELSGLGNEWLAAAPKANVITYYPREGMPRSEHDRSVYERAGIVFQNRYNSAGVLSDIDVYFKKDGIFQVTAQGGSRKTAIFSHTVDSRETNEDIENAQKEDQKYTELLTRESGLKKKEKGQWQKLNRGTQGARGLEYAYRMTNGIMQAYHPVDGLFQFDRVNAKWYKTGNPNPSLEEAYNKAIAKGVAPEVTEKTADGTASSSEAPPSGKETAPPTLPPEEGTEK